jgi:hypothetical protein
MISKHKTLTGNFYGEVKVKEFSDSLSIELLDLFQNPDCKVGHFGYNFFYRTAGACDRNFKGYKTIAILKREVKKLLTKNGLTVESFSF